jgi:cysteine synthase A
MRPNICADITEAIGHTPLLWLRRMGAELPGRIAVKHEGLNPFGSIKDRIGVAMIDEALERGWVRPGTVLVEPTSGNTGIGIAFAAVQRGLRCVITLPETSTIERQNLLRALGCKVVLTPGEDGVRGAVEAVERIRERLGEGGWMLSQVTNPGNPAAHYRTTGPEIWEDTRGEIDVLIAGVGTGGTITGTGRFLKERKPAVHIVAVEPAESPLLAEGKPGPHQQIGLSGGFITDVMDTNVYDEIFHVTNEEAFATTRRLAREEAIFAGISSGPAAWAALQVAAREESRGKLIVVILPDAGDRYLSNPVYAEMPEPDFADVAGALE